MSPYRKNKTLWRSQASQWQNDSVAVRNLGSLVLKYNSYLPPFSALLCPVINIVFQSCLGLISKLLFRLNIQSLAKQNSLTFTSGRLEAASFWIADLHPGSGVISQLPFIILLVRIFDLQGGRPYKNDKIKIWTLVLLWCYWISNIIAFVSNKSALEVY